MKIVAGILALPVRLYRIAVSPLLGPACRFHPSCSAYAVQALERHGAVKGLWLAVLRIMRCNPWAAHGLDPVPERFAWRAPILYKDGHDADEQKR